MTHHSEQPEPDPRWEEKEVELQEVVLSNSWALQSILEYLEEQQPGARERIFELYNILQAKANQAKSQNSTSEEQDTSDSDSDSKP